MDLLDIDTFVLSISLETVIDGSCQAVHNDHINKRRGIREADSVQTSAAIQPGVEQPFGQQEDQETPKDDTRHGNQRDTKNIVFGNR